MGAAPKRMGPLGSPSRADPCPATNQHYRYQPRDPEARRHDSAYARQRDSASRGHGQPDAPQKRSQRQLDDQRAFQPSSPQGTSFGRDHQQPQRSREDARRSDPSTTPPRYREWNGQVAVPAPQPQHRQERQEQPQARRKRGTTGGKQMDRNATGRASLHHSKDLSHCFKQIVYLKQSPSFGVCIRDIGIDLFHGAGSDPTKPSI